MALTITVGGIDRAASLKAGTMRIVQTVDGTQGTADFGLIDLGISTGVGVLIADGATTYFNGTCRQSTQVARPKDLTKFESAISCQDDAAVSAATSAAAFGLSYTPNNTTTFGFDNLSMVDDSTSQTLSAGGQVISLETWKAGLTVGQTVQVTVPAGTPFATALAAPVRILRITITFPTSKSTAPLFKLECSKSSIGLARMFSPRAATAFPTGVAGQRVYRDDKSIEFVHDGTRWLSTALLTEELTTSQMDQGIAATDTFLGYRALPKSQGTDLWLVDAVCRFKVAAGGTALGASHSWVGLLQKEKSDLTVATLATFTVNSGASGVWRDLTVAINALADAANYYAYLNGWTKTGTPGSMFSTMYVTYRIVG